MRAFKLITILFVLAAFTVALSGAAMSAPKQKCPLCGMNMAGNENTAYEITMKSGKKVSYCCPHCGLWEHQAKKAKVKSARARDFISGEWTDATKMFYVVESSAVPACAPSWIAFANKSDADNFIKGFGGRALGFEDAVMERAKQPKGMQMK